jgi:hypothetical protein
MSAELTAPCSIAPCRADGAAARRGTKDLPSRKKKTFYPPARTDTRPAPFDPSAADVYVRPTVASIDTNAGRGRGGLAVGDRVRISGTGLYAGEAAVIEKLVSGVIPAALVRTEAGRTRQVRTIDLEPLPAA